MEGVSGDFLAEAAAQARPRRHVPGIAVGLLRDGDAVFAADGVCELGRDELVTPETQFRIASVTKPFAVSLAMALIQDGELALDEPPPGTAAHATVRQLLSNQGGLASEWPEPLDSAGEDDEALLRLAGRGAGELPVGAGELFSYANVGFWFAAAACARACGTSFENALGTRVLGPLELEATGFEPTAAAARGHQQVEPGADE